MSKQKSFLGEPLLDYLSKIPEDATPLWGKMNIHQVVEHLADAVKLATKNNIIPLITPIENLERMNAFAKSDRPLRQNTINPIMPENPAPTRKKTIQESLEVLKQSLEKFHENYALNPEMSVLNPFFGDLDYEGQSNLLYKHCLHHLAQFGLTVEE